MCKCEDSPRRNPGVNTKVQGQESSPSQGLENQSPSQGLKNQNQLFEE